MTRLIAIVFFRMKSEKINDSTLPFRQLSAAQLSIQSDVPRPLYNALHNAIINIPTA